MSLKQNPFAKAGHFAKYKGPNLFSGIISNVAHLPHLSLLFNFFPRTIKNIEITIHCYLMIHLSVFYHCGIKMWAKGYSEELWHFLSQELVLLWLLSGADLFDIASDWLLILTAVVAEQLLKSVPAQYFKFVFPLNHFSLLTVFVHFVVLFLCCSNLFQSLDFLLMESSGNHIFRWQLLIKS